MFLQICVFIQQCITSLCCVCVSTDKGIFKASWSVSKQESKSVIVIVKFSGSGETISKLAIESDDTAVFDAATAENDASESIVDFSRNVVYRFTADKYLST